MSAAPELRISPLVYIVVLTWNSEKDIVECLDSLQRLDYPNYQVIVVDNGSSDDTLAKVRAQFGSTPIIENGQNLGFAEGNNVGIHYALAKQADYVFILNDDTAIAPDAISLLVECGESNPRIGMLGSSVVSYYDHSKEFLGARVDWQTGLTFQILYSPTGMGDADHVAGCALLVKSHVAREIGLFDADFFCYYEDTDWGVRCNRAGYRVITVFPSKVYHKGTPDATGHESPSLFYYYRRNQCLFMRKYTKGLHWWLFLIRYTIQCLLQFYYHARRGQNDKADAVIAGFWAGVTRRRGAARISAPTWFRQSVFRVMRFLHWLLAPILVWRKQRRTGVTA